MLVSAYLVGLKRDPQTAHDFNKHLPAAAELVADKRTTDEVEGCARWMASDPWRKSNGKKPSLADVAVALPGWIDDGRPESYQPPQKGAAKGAQAIANVIASQRTARLGLPMGSTPLRLTGGSHD